jgi:putative ABC transport system permease protein
MRAPRLSRFADALGRDGLYALRLLRKSPLFTLTAAVTLALGVGGNAAIFSMVDALLLRSLPYPDAGRLALVEKTYRQGEVEDQEIGQTGRTWEAVRDHARTVEPAVFSDWVTGVNLFAAGEAAHVRQQRVGAGFFHVLGVPPLVGRGFTPDEDRPGGPAVVVLGHGLWQRAFGADPAIVGRSLLLRGEPYTVVGVMPEGFRSTSAADLWTPLRASTSGEGEGENYGILVRLRPGVASAQARAELGGLAEAVWAERPAPAGWRRSLSLVPLQRGLTGEVRRPLLLLWAAVGLVLLIVCANLATLLLARAGQRRREIATRLAIGGGRGAVARQMLVESVVLAALGGVLGVAFGAFALEVLAPQARQAFGIWQPVALDLPTLGVTAAVALATSLAFGLGPALAATRLDPRAALGDGARGGSRGGAGRWGRRLLVVGEIALSVLLLVAAGLLTRTFLELRGLAPGLDPRGVVTATASLQDARYQTRAEIVSLFDETLERLRRDPGVEAAAVSLGLPYERLLNLGARVVGGGAAGGEEHKGMTQASYVTPGFFAALRIPLRRGRLLAAEDGPQAPPVVVVNEAFAEAFLRGGDPLGSRIAVAGQEREVVGVVASVEQQPADGSEPLARVATAYLPVAQLEDDFFPLVHTWFQPSWIVRSALPAGATVTALREAIAEVDPRLPIAAFREMDDVEAAALASQRFLMTLIALLAGIGVVLAAVGIHGLIAGAVAERTRELGIRLALGATFAQAIGSVTLPGLGLALAGIAAGGALAVAASRVLGHFLWGVSATDPPTLVAAGIALLLLAAAAGAGPALRVLRLDPARTLRHE